MPRSATATSLFLEDEPALKFEEPSASRHVATAPQPGVYQHISENQAATHDDPYASLKNKQEHLLKLRQELERTERETSQMEALRKKEDRFDSGRREIAEKLSRALVRLDRELYNAQKAIEEINAARDLYQRHLDVIRTLHPERWDRSNLDGELDRSIAAIEDAEIEFSKTSRRLASTLPGEAGIELAGAASFPRDFKTWLRIGFAASLPLIALATLNFIIQKFFH